MVEDKKHHEVTLDNNVMVLGTNSVFSLDCKETKHNNNVLVVGASGTGKTRGIVSPNLLMASGSYIVSDPKGNLYLKYKNYLEQKGYIVKKLDFTDPMNSIHYNFLNYIREPRDIIKAAHMLVYEEASHKEPFWDQTSSMLLSSLISYCIECLPPEKRNFRTIETMLQMGKRDEYASSSKSCLDSLFEHREKEYPDSWSVKQYKNVAVAPERTFNSILISLTAKLRNYTSEETLHMMEKDDVHIATIGNQKTALFVVVSDTDRSMDNLANLFFTQAMNELCWHADHNCAGNELSVPVRFILDDFATNCRIDEFPRMIASVRSRGISTMLMIQAESQLMDAYGLDGRTIIGNCDSYIYLGGTDIETAKAVAERCDLPLKKVLNMPIGKNIIFRRGEEPKHDNNINLEEYEIELGFQNDITDNKRVEDSRTLAERLSGKMKNKEQRKEVERPFRRNIARYRDNKITIDALDFVEKDEMTLTVQEDESNKKVSGIE